MENNNNIYQHDVYYTASEEWEVGYSEWAAQLEADRMECLAYEQEQGYDWS